MGVGMFTVVGEGVMLWTCWQMGCHVLLMRSVVGQATVRRRVRVERETIRCWGFPVWVIHFRSVRYYVCPFVWTAVFDGKSCHLAGFRLSVRRDAQLMPDDLIDEVVTYDSTVITPRG